MTMNHSVSPVARRYFLRECGVGLGKIAAGALMSGAATAEAAGPVLDLQRGAVMLISGAGVFGWNVCPAPRPSYPRWSPAACPAIPSISKVSCRTKKAARRA